MLFGVYAIPALLSSVWIVIEKINYHRVLSNSSCLLIFSFREKKPEVYGPVPPDVECFGVELETGVHISFIMALEVVLMVVRALLGWSSNARHKAK